MKQVATFARTLSMLATAALLACGGDASRTAGPTAPAKFRPGVTFTAGQGLVDTIDAFPATQVVVSVADADGVPRPRVPVSLIFLYDVKYYTVFNGLTKAEPFDPFTDSLGKAAFRLQLGHFSGTWRLVAIDPATGSADTLSFTILPGQPAHVRLSPRDTAAYVARTFRLRPVQTDRWGNPASTEARLTFSSDSGFAAMQAFDGSVTGVALGRSRLTARMDGGDADTVRVSVVPMGVLAATIPPGSDTPGLAMLNLDGSGYRLLTSGNAYFPSWSPDGGSIAYSDDIEHGVLYRVDTNGVKTRLSTPSPMPSEVWPRYSYDGLYVYYAAGTYPFTLDTYRVLADGTGPRVQVSATRPAGHNGFWAASPSPDGTLLTYIEAGGPLHVLTLATGTDRTLPVAANAPRFSPDGSWIAFEDPSSFGLQIVHPDGSGRRQLTPPGMLVESDGHDWTTDGQWIVFKGGFESGGYYGLRLVRVADNLILPLPFNDELRSPALRLR
jgi:Tol biopolymer transport system component